MMVLAFATRPHRDSESVQRRARNAAGSGSLSPKAAFAPEPKVLGLKKELLNVANHVVPIAASQDFMEEAIDLSETLGWMHHGGCLPNPSHCTSQILQGTVPLQASSVLPRCPTQVIEGNVR